MAEEKVGPRLVRIILAAVVLLLLLGLLIYLTWREANRKPKEVPQRASAVQLIEPNCTESLL
jgi:hypothetical protein